MTFAATRRFQPPPIQIESDTQGVRLSASSSQFVDRNSVTDPAPHSASNQRSLSATTKQLRAITAIAGKMKLEPVRFVRELYPVERLDQLSLAQASSVINALKRQQQELV